MGKKQTGPQISLVWKWLLDGFLCLLLISMIGLACLQIGLRTFFSSGLLWADPLLRYLVLWSGMLGAVVATRERKHIAIDVVGYLAPQQIKPWLQLALDLFSCLVTGSLTWAAIVFVRNEASFGGSSLLSLPSWVWNLIFPLAFFLITVHFLLALIKDVQMLFSRPGGQETEPEPAP